MFSGEGSNVLLKFQISINKFQIILSFKVQHSEVKTKENPGFDIDKLLKTEIQLFGKKFNDKKKEAFYSELGVLLQAGISLKEALQLITKEQAKRQDAVLIEQIHDAMVQGTSLSKAMQAQQVFTSYEYYSIQIGEETGALPRVIQELSLYFRRKNEQRRLISGALTYPIVVMFTAFLAVFFMLRYVVPMFAGIFKNQQADLPRLTRMIITLSDAFQKNFLWFVLVLLLLYVFWRVFRNNANYRKYSSLLLLKIPYVNKLIRKMYLAQYTQATALLISAQVPMLHSIRLTKKMIPFYPLQKALEDVEQKVTAGKSLSESLTAHPIFDKKMISLIKVAEETNQNALIFERLSTQYSEEVQYQSKTLSTLIEPFIIIVLGAVVALILIAMYLPMFKLSTVIG